MILLAYHEVGRRRDVRSNKRILLVVVIIINIIIIILILFLIIIIIYYYHHYYRYYYFIIVIAILYIAFPSLSHNKLSGSRYHVGPELSFYSGKCDTNIYF